MDVPDIVYQLAPPGIEAIREIDPATEATYRRAASAPERLLLRIDERPEGHRSVPFVMLAVVPIVLLAFAAAVASGLLQFALFATGVFWAAVLFEERHRLGAGVRKPSFGYRGTLRLEHGWLHSPSPGNDRPDVATDLTRLEKVHVVGTESGTNLVLAMRDGEVLELATGIADIKVARYVAERITEAAHTAKR
jgi:hypothetical protein